MVKLSDFEIDGLSARYWSKVERTPSCWIWLGARDKRGNGSVALRKKGRSSGSMTAKSVAWLLTYGEIPERMDVLHTCANMLCINPMHLRLQVAQTTGAKLSWEEVAEIRGRYSV